VRGRAHAPGGIRVSCRDPITVPRIRVTEPVAISLERSVALTVVER